MNLPTLSISLTYLPTYLVFCLFVCSFLSEGRGKQPSPQWYRGEALIKKKAPKVGTFKTVPDPIWSFRYTRFTLGTGGGRHTVTDPGDSS